MNLAVIGLGYVGLPLPLSSLRAKRGNPSPQA
jgi:UDP-N-acetyl-D-mannosaminuronate dehydrogenase